MTAYNRQAYIAEAIESVLASSYANFELIIVDDQSTDDTVQIAREFSAKDSRVKVYVNECNLGDYLNRNKAASYASGKYLKYIDSDDLIYSHGLQVMVEAMEKFPQAGLGLPYQKIEDTQPYPYLVDSGTAYRQFFFNEDFLLSGPTGAIIRRDLFEEVGRFSGKRFVGDTELWLTLAARRPVVKFQPALFWWRQHEFQEYRNGQSVDGYYILSYLMLKEVLADINCPMNEQDRKRAMARLTKKQSRLVLHIMLKKADIRGGFRIMEKCSLSFFDVIRNSFRNA
jgi:glycosyltransferase involved in cell wall biosynthesis